MILRLPSAAKHQHDGRQIFIVNFFRVILRRLRGRSKRRKESFDVDNRRSWEGLSDPSGVRLGAWSLADAERSVDGAARVASNLLRTRRWIRYRFPMAVSEGEAGCYAKWLMSRGASKFGFSRKAAENIGAAFRAEPGQRVLRIYLHSPDLQKRFPLALLTAGQKSFVKWLTRHGRAKYGLTNEEIVWFLYQTAEQLPQMVLRTWLITPAWQNAFRLQHAGTAEEFVRWVRQEFAGCPRFSQLKMLPAIAENFQKSISRQATGESIDGVNVLSHFCYPSGLQQAGLLTARALKSAGLKVSCRDVPTSLAHDIESRAPFFGLEIFPVTIVNVSPQTYFRDVYERSGLLRQSGVYRIAYWLWELDDIPTEWIELAPLVDEIWAPTRFVAEAFRRRMPTPVYEISLPVYIGEIERLNRSDFGIPADNYVFLFMFDMCSEMIRKNPLAVIRAFRCAFPNPRDVTLIIKVSRGSDDAAGLADLRETSAGSGILVIDRLLSHSQTLGLSEMCDCFVSLHRSEGFGLSLAEAMMMGKPVIATNYSGNLAFMHPRNSLLVDYTLKEIAQDNRVYRKGNHWADPSVEQAASYMRWCYAHRAEAAALGSIGQAEVEKNLSVETAGQRMLDRLSDCAVHSRVSGAVTK